MHRWFSGRIVACHNIDPCSTPGQGHLLPAHEKSATYYHRIAEKNAHADENVHAEENAHAEKNMNIENVPISVVKHRWFSGRIVACHAIDPSSILGCCNLLSAHKNCAKLLSKNSREKCAHRGKMRTQRKIYDYRVCPYDYCQASVV